MSGKYGAALALIGVVEIAGFAMLAVTAFAALNAFQSAGALGAVVVTAGGVTLSLLLMAFAQLARAQVDTAINTARLVELLDHSKREREAGRPSDSDAAATADSRNYKGHLIRSSGFGVVVGNQTFPNVAAAQRWIDGDN